MRADIRNHTVESLESRTLLNAGALNLAFGGGDGRLLFPAPSGGDVAMAVATQPDGKFVLAGSAVQSGKKVAWLERLDSRGTPDSTFGISGVVRQTLSDFVRTRDIARQSDGKFVLVGDTTSGGFIARFTSSGKLDNSFGGGDGIATTSAFLYKIALLPNGNIAALGNGNRVYEFTAAGSRNSSFGSNGSTQFLAGLTGVKSFYAADIDAQKDDKLIITGTAGLVPEPYNDSEGAIGVVRLTTSGKFDNTFANDGFTTIEFTGHDQSDGAAIQSTGRIVLTGVDDNSNTYVVGLNPNGSMKFETMSDWSSSFAEGPSGITVDSSDRIIVMGHSNPDESSEVGYSDQDFAVQRLSADGVFEWSKFVDFATPDHGRDDYAYAAAVARDGNIIVVGQSEFTDSGDGEQVAVASIQGKSGGPGDAIPVTFGDDKITINGTASADNILVTPTDRSQVFVEFNGNVNHYFLGGTDIVVNGNRGNDRIELAGPVDYGNVTLNGGAGNDTLIGSKNTDSPIGSTETFIGGSGNDTADYSARGDNLTITLDNKANDGAAGEKDNVMADIETILGGSGNDKLTGNPFANVLKGNAGNDTLYGGAGNDTLDGGSGRDMLFGQDGNDTLLAKDGRVDSLDGGAGTDSAQRDDSTTVKDQILNIESFI